MLIAFFITCCIICVCILISGLVYPHMPTVEKYDISSDKLQNNQRFILLTDLHGCSHGKKNEKLIQMIKEENPDYLCIAGDMTVKDGLCADEMIQFLSVLSREYPIYYSPGNHEIRMPNYFEYKQRLKNIGVTYLENSAIPIGGNVMIYGLDLPEYWYHKVWQKRTLQMENLKELVGTCECKSFCVLLAHNPEYAKQYAMWGADLTLSGHVHGGIMRLPFLGGVIAPSLQLFPRYDAGMFTQNQNHMIISRGLGLHHIKLRFFNRPEVSVINLTCQKSKK